MKKTVIRPLSFISSLIVFITLSTVLARSVAAADLTLQITQNTVSATGLLTSTVELQNTAGNVAFSRYDDTGGKNSNPIPVGRITLTVTNTSANPLFTVVTATAYG